MLITGAFLNAFELELNPNRTLERVRQGSVRGSPENPNRTESSVHGSQKMPREPH
jgi:hypothetical protein